MPVFDMLMQPDGCLVHVDMHDLSTRGTVVMQEIRPAPDSQCLRKYENGRKPPENDTPYLCPPVSNKHTMGLKTGVGLWTPFRPRRRAQRHRQGAWVAFFLRQEGF